MVTVYPLLMSQYTECFRLIDELVAETSDVARFRPPGRSVGDKLSVASARPPVKAAEKIERKAASPIAGVPPAAEVLLRPPPAKKNTSSAPLLPPASPAKHATGDSVASQRPTASKSSGAPAQSSAVEASPAGPATAETPQMLVPAKPSPSSPSQFPGARPSAAPRLQQGQEAPTAAQMTSLLKPKGSPSEPPVPVSRPAPPANRPTATKSAPASRAADKDKSLLSRPAALSKELPSSKKPRLADSSEATVSPASAQPKANVSELKERLTILKLKAAALEELSVMREHAAQREREAADQRASATQQAPKALAKSVEQADIAEDDDDMDDDDLFASLQGVLGGEAEGETSLGDVPVALNEPSPQADSTRAEEEDEVLDVPMSDDEDLAGLELGEADGGLEEDEEAIVGYEVAELQQYEEACGDEVAEAEEEEEEDYDPFSTEPTAA